MRIVIVEHGHCHLQQRSVYTIRGFLNVGNYAPHEKRSEPDYQER